MKTIKLFLMAALALMTAACSNDDSDIVQQPATPKAEGITITATLAPKTSDGTRALEEKNNKIVVTWAVNEEIAILYKVGNEDKKAVAKVNSVAGDGSATIGFTVDGSTQDGTPCTLVYPASAAKDDNSGVKDAATLLASQNGSLSNTNLDVRVGGGTIQTATPGLTVTTQPAAQFAIFNFSGTKQSGGIIELNTLTVTIGSQNYVISYGTPQAGSSNFYAALPPVSGQTVSFLAKDGDGKLYYYDKNDVTFSAGKYYQSTLTMQELLLTGEFSVASNKKVYFSQGNLRYNGNKDWKFADNQWEYIGSNTDNLYESSATKYPMEFFTWGNIANPAYDGTTYDTGSDVLSGTRDWGSNMAGNWRTLSSTEWTFLLNERTTGGTVFSTSSARYTFATINTDMNYGSNNTPQSGVQGIILFPDGVNITTDEVTTAGDVNTTSAWVTKCTSDQWTALAAKGCVFLPAAGYRNGNSISGINTNGYYWSSTTNGVSDQAFALTFTGGNITIGNNSTNATRRSYGCSVRLVHDAPSNPSN